MIEFIGWWALSVCFYLVAAEVVDSWDGDGFGSWTRFVPRIVMAVIVITIVSDVIAPGWRGD